MKRKHSQFDPRALDKAPSKARLDCVYILIISISDSLNGFFYVSDIIKLSILNKNLNLYIRSKNVIEDIVRIGNLDKKLRKQLWKQLYPREQIKNGLFLKYS